MADAVLPNIDQARSVTDALWADLLIALKENRDADGNLLGDLPESQASQDATAEWGNYVDGLLLVMARRLGGVLRSVREYGAELDGVVSDSLAFQNCVDAGNGIVVVPPGTVNATYTIPSGVRTLHICSGTPEGARRGSPGDVAIRLDGSFSQYVKRTGSSTTTGWVPVGRVAGHVGTALVAGNFALSAGWGNTATVSAIASGSTDGRGTLTVTANGSGLATSPTITLTYADGAFAAAPFVLASRTGGNGSPAHIYASTTTTTMQLLYAATPSAGFTYQFTWGLR